MNGMTNGTRNRTANGMDATTQLLKALTDAHGIGGYEEPIRAVMRSYLEPLGPVTTDHLGSLICALPGEGPRVMLAAHMDEIGFIVTHITKEGFLKFMQVGGWFDQVMLGHRYIVKTHKGDVIGTMGTKPPHLLLPEDREKVIKKQTMYIDVGASSEDEVKAMGVRVGDPVVPDSEFVVMNGGQTYMAKAFDDRVGCALLVEALRELRAEQDSNQGRPRPNAVYGAVTVMEEPGLRGAITSAHVVNPDVAIILESGIAGDVPGVLPEESTQRLGGGPVIGVADMRHIWHLKFRDLVYATAEELGLTVQPSFMERGATDGGMIHVHKTGVPTIVLSVAARHIHSHNAIIHRKDYDDTLRLLVALVRKLDAKTVNEFRMY